MAKKRSKTSKQKQAKATRQFGVSVKKGGGRERTETVEIDGTKTTIKKVGGGDSSKNLKWNTKPKKQQNGSKQRDPNEQDDFRNRMKGLEERHVWHKNRSRNDVIAKKQGIQISEATLIVDDKHKSTQRLVHETATQLTTGFGGIGQGGSIRTQQPGAVFQPTNKLQVMAQQQREAWVEESKLETDNPYSALEISDDDEDGDNMNSVRKPQVALFQFAPPSFGAATDVDPDL